MYRFGMFSNTILFRIKRKIIINGKRISLSRIICECIQHICSNNYLLNETMMCQSIEEEMYNFVHLRLVSYTLCACWPRLNKYRHVFSPRIFLNSTDSLLVFDDKFSMYKSHFTIEFPFYRNEAKIKQQN